MAVEPQWDYYLQAFRLHQGLSRGANSEAQLLLKQANSPAALAQDRVLPRAYGLLSFTIQTAWLSDWIDAPKAQEILTGAIADVETVTEKRKLPPKTLDDLKKPKGSIDAIIKSVNLAYAEVAAALDGEDFDNQWSLATANLYARNFAAAFDGYVIAKTLAGQQQAADVSKGSIAADNADALFFGCGPAAEPSNDDYRQAIEQAIADTQAAIDGNPGDPKRHWWDWTLGWAYYELGGYSGELNEMKNCARSLMILQRFKRPHDLIRKNLMASQAALGMIEPAQQLAIEFMARNPNYTLAVEHRWPYRSDAQRERWKGHLRMAGLPD